MNETDQSEGNPYQDECEQELRETVAAVELVDVDAIADWSKEQLENKLNEYSEQGQALQLAFTEADSAFKRELVAYSQVFEKVEVIEQAAEVTLGREPDGAISSFQETFQTIEMLSGITRYSSIVSGLLMIKKLYNWRQAVVAARGVHAAVPALPRASWPLTASRAQPGWAKAVAASDDIVKIRRMAAMTGALSLVTAGASIAMKHYTDKQLRDYYLDAVPSYQEWYTQTSASVITLCGLRKLMRAEMESLKEQLEVAQDPENPQSTDQALIDTLNGSIKSVSELEAMMMAAERMICSDLSVLDAAKLSGVPHDPDDPSDPILVLLSNRRLQLLADGKAVCQDRYPELFV